MDSATTAMNQTGEPNPGIQELGHVGLMTDDLATMRTFYTEVLGLTVTDEEPALGLVFLSSRPEIEHHELVLSGGRVTPSGTRLMSQLSWRLDSIATLQEFHRRLLDAEASIQHVVTHGNAIGVYFRDPEGNPSEVYVQTGDDVPQPFFEPISLDGDPSEVLARSRALVHAGTS